MRLTYSDARRGAKQADLCDDCAGEDAGPRDGAPRPPAEVAQPRSPFARRTFALFPPAIDSARSPFSRQAPSWTAGLRWVGWG